MTFKQFWYCVRLELGQAKASPNYRIVFREGIKLFLPWKFQKQKPEHLGHKFIFVIITENHLKHFRPVSEMMRAENQPFSIFFTNAALLQKHAYEWPDISFLIQSLATWQLYFRAVLFQITLLLAYIKYPKSEKAAIVRFAKPVYLIHKVMIELLVKSPRKVVLFKAEGYHANAILAACQQTQTPSFAIQHGLIGDTEQVSHLSVDNYLVWSDFFKKRLERWEAGCDIKIVGNAAYDSVFQIVKKSAVPELAFTPFQVLILPNAGISHTPLNQVYQLLDIALGFAYQNPTVLITVKPHPADVQGNVAKYVSQHLKLHSNIRLLDRFEAIPFEHSHVVAINNSAAGMEACIWKKPLLVFAPTWEDVMVKQYVAHGVAEFANTPEIFEEKVLKIRTHYADYQEKCCEFTQDQLAYHGRAAEKIVEELTC